MLPIKVQDACTKIGYFYLQKNNNNYEKTAEDLDRLRITKIHVDGNSIVITLCRPGILVGERGENITALVEWLKPMDVKIMEEQDDIYGYLVPYEPNEKDYA